VILRGVEPAGDTGLNGGGNVLQVGVLEIRPDEGLAIAGGRALRLSVREFGLLAALARQDGRIVRREDLYEHVWGVPLRHGDRTIDVYVRKLRVKLEQSLPEWRFIHTHVGFGYRFQPERSHGFHTDATTR
jgi:DNA-binding response OmpR family regulator